MKPIALDSKPEEPLTHDSRACAGRLDSATPISVSCSPFTDRISSEHLNESVGAITCTTPNCASVDQCNQQYSIYALTDSSGKVSERYAYTAYGQPTFLNASATVQTSSAAGNRYTYTGREWDPTIGLHHFRARWMSGVSGRFLTRDPIGYWEGPNLTSIRIGLSLFDPTGFCVEPCECFSSNVTLGNVKRDKELEGQPPRNPDGRKTIGAAELIWHAEGKGQGSRCKFVRKVYGKEWAVFDGQLTVFDGGDDGEVWAEDGPRFSSRYLGRPVTTLVQNGNRWKFDDYDRPAFGVYPKNTPAHRSAYFIEYVVNEDGKISPACCNISRLEIHIDKNMLVTGSFKSFGGAWVCSGIAKEIENGREDISKLLPPIETPTNM